MQILHRRKAFRTVFSPLDLSPVVWLDASASTTLYDATTGGSLVAADGLVARWENKIANGWNPIQGTSGSRPTRKTAVQNGLDCLLFASDFMAYTAAIDLLKNKPGASIYCVRKFSSNPTAEQDIVNIRRTADVGTRAGLFGGTTSGKPSVGGRRLDANVFAAVASSTSVSTSDFELQTGIMVYSSSDAYLYINGSLAASSTSFQTDGNTSDTTSSGIGIASSGGGADLFQGYIGEVVVFESAHSALDMGKMHTYLSAKWGITLA